MEISDLMNSLINKLHEIDNNIESLIDFNNIINLIKNENEEAIKILFKTITDKKYKHGSIYDDIILELSNFYLNENNIINAKICLGNIKDKTNQNFISKCSDITKQYSILLTKKQESIGKCCLELFKHYPENIDIFADYLDNIQNIIYTEGIEDYLTEFQKFVNEDLENQFKNFKNEIDDIIKNNNYILLNSLYDKRDKSNPNIFIVDDKETMKSIIKSYFSLTSKTIEYISSNDSMQPGVKDLTLNIIIIKAANTINNIEGDFSEVNGSNKEKVDEFKEFYNTGLINGISIGNANYLENFENNPAIIYMAKTFEKKGSEVGLEIFTKFYLNNKEKFKNDYKNSLKLRYDLNKSDHFAAEFYLDFLIEENLYESIDELKNILIELKQRIELLGKDNPDYNKTNGEIVRTFDKIVKQFSKKGEDILELKEVLNSFANLYEEGIEYIGGKNTKNIYNYMVSEQKFFEEYWKLIKDSNKSKELELFNNFVNIIKNQEDIDIPECNIISFLSNIESTMIEESRIKHGSDMEKIKQSLNINSFVEYFNKLCTEKNINKEKIERAFNYIIEKTNKINNKEVQNIDKDQITLFLTNLLNKNEIDLSLIEDNKEILEKLVGNDFSTFVSETLTTKRNLFEDAINNKKPENKEKIEDIEQVILKANGLEDDILTESISKSIDELSPTEEETEKTFP